MIEENFRNPDISIEQHIDARARSLTEQLAGKIAVYLDTRFWIVVREVRDGVRTGSSERKLVHHLEALVGAGRAFCPIAEPTFFELMKQGDRDQRVRTAQAVDDLSGGASLLPDIDRMPGEARDLLLSTLAGGEARSFVPWTGLGFVLGNLYPADTIFSAREERAVQKAVYDRLWETPLAQIVATLDSDSWSRPHELEAAAFRLNHGNERHRHQMKSFEHVLEQEFHGVALTCAEMLPEFAHALARMVPAMPISAEQFWTNAFREMLKNPKQARQLPTAHIHATIHALFRWEYRDKVIVPNDLVDFRHAAAALGHCDALLTERGLERTLTHRRRPLQEIHQRIVISNLDQAVDYLCSLRQGQPMHRQSDR